MKTNQMAELKQWIPTFSNPANQMSGTKQLNLNLFVVMLTQLQCLLINCQAQAISIFTLENIVLLYFRFHIYIRDKLIRLTVFWL